MLPVWWTMMESIGTCRHVTKQHFEELPQMRGLRKLLMKHRFARILMDSRAWTTSFCGRRSTSCRNISRAWLHVLRDGSFVNPSQHKKYDVTKITTCPLCHQEDSVAHRVRGCSMLESVYAEFPQLVEERDILPSAFYERLLPSRNPWHGPLRSRLARMNDLLEWHASPSRVGDLHLFTDGSCSSPDWPEASLASFACISAGADELVFRGICGGSIQSSDLAELKAVRYAIQWSEASGGNVVIWTDSAYVATGVNRLLADVNDIPEGAYYDEWICIQQLVGSRIDSIQIHHVAAHLCATNDFQTVTEWSTYWNDRVDHEAKLAARLWDAEVQALQAQLSFSCYQDIELSLSAAKPTSCST